jgi:membrane-associated protease RseP (regulator of RpoE activity)
MRSVLRRPVPAILALLLLAAGPLFAAPQKAPPPPAPPAPAAPPAPPAAPAPPDIDVEPGDVDVEMEEHGPALVTIVRGPQAYIGLRLLDLTPELRELYTGSVDTGVLVSSVEAGSPAAKAGVKVGDVIAKVDGTRVSRPSEISRAVRRKEGGEKVSLEVRRDKAAKTIEIPVAQRKAGRHEIRMPGFSFRTADWEERISERVDRALDRMQEKLRRVEERLKELERRWQKK